MTSPGPGRQASAAARLAVTGAGGRLGSALIRAARARGATALPWRRPEYDLDDPELGSGLIERDRPTVVLHAAAWTDVDGCARDPALALRRNADAVGYLAEACVRAGVGLALVSTNEVFDGERIDGRGYVESDSPAPRNAYGRSKLAGEIAARAAFGDRAGLWIVRTSWLYGPPGGDFPHKILAASDRLPKGEGLAVVDDEFGTPTYTADLAHALLQLVEATPAGIYHLVSPGIASRLEWAEAVIVRRRPDRAIRPISRVEFTRASDVPPWGVLDPGRAASLGISLRPWRAALDAYLDGID